MSLKAYLVNLEKEITVKIPAELTADGQAITAVFKKGDALIKENWGKFWGEIEAEILKLEASWPGLTLPVHGVEVTIADPVPTVAESVPAPEPADPVAARGPDAPAQS